MEINGKEKNPFKYVIDTDAEEDAKEISDEAISDLQNIGTSMFKVRKGNKCFQRLFKLDLDKKRLNYSPTQKIQVIPCLKTPPFIDLLDAIEVRKGWKTDKFNVIERLMRERYIAKEPYPRAAKEENCLSIIFPAKSKTFDLIAPNKEMRNLWFKALRRIIKDAKADAKIGASDIADNDDRLQEAFKRYDVDNKNSLDVHQVKLFLESIDILISDAHLGSVFSRSDVIKGRSEKKKESRLNFSEFKTLIDILTTRKDILDIFNICAKNGSMDASCLKSFLDKDQKESRSKEECNELISMYGSSDAKLTPKCFQRLMQDMNIFDERHKTVHQDMTQPLSHYFIASSHNTYLLGDQLQSTSSVEAYVSVLKSGCRCVELDLWDGDDEEPIIYHGYTLTTKILLRDVLEAIYDNAFETSKFPIILSLENHLSIEQQKVAALYFTGILGDMLLTAPLSDDETKWPSPEELSYKIIIKGKKLTSGGDTVDGPSRRTSTATSPGDDFEQYEASYGAQRTMFKLKMPPKKHITNISDYSDIGNNFIAEEEDDEDAEEDAVDLFDDKNVDLVDDHCQPDDVHHRPEDEAGQSEASNSGSGVQSDDDVYKTASSNFPSPDDQPDRDAKSFPTDTNNDREPQIQDVATGESKDGPSSPLPPVTVQTTIKTPSKAAKIAQELSDITIYCHARHFKTFELSKEWIFYEMASFEERKAAELASTERASFINYNLNNLSRIYPKGLRTNSSNYKPNIYWASGCQLVALNYQTPDKAMKTNDALFDMNGRCGYVLKPQFLRKSYDKDAKNIGVNNEFLKVTIISGQTLGERVLEKDKNMDTEPLSPNEPMTASPISPASPSASNQDIPDPFVSVKIFGDPNDKQKFKTKYVKNDVYNPIWNQTFEFEVKCFEICFLQFKVKNYSNSEKLGETVLPLAAVKEGYRHVSLKDVKGKVIKSSTLFVKIERITNYDDVTMKRLINAADKLKA